MECRLFDAIAKPVRNARSTGSLWRSRSWVHYQTTGQTHQAFNHTAVDYAGPFLTQQGRGRSLQKRYICVFTCLHTRACHLELAYGLDTDSFLMAFNHFTKRHGKPVVMVPDNGTNFVEAESELQEAYKNLDMDEVICRLVIHGITWKFNPPRAPHHGGVFEVMVCSVKRALIATIAHGLLSDEELHTALVQAEHMINSRPLTTVSSDPDDLSPLTPFHFLVGRVDLPSAWDMEDTVHPRRRWQVLQQLTRDLWKRRLKEFAPKLNIRKSSSNRRRIMQLVTLSWSWQLTHLVAAGR